MGEPAFHAKIRSPWVDAIASAGEKERFLWSADDDAHVMGPIGDALLRKLRARGYPATQSEDVQKHHEMTLSPMSPTAWRRRSCKALGSVCQRHEPVICLPVSLMSNLELATDLKAAARSLLVEHGPEIVPTIMSDDLFLDVEEPAPNGAPLFQDPGSVHIAAYRLRPQRQATEMDAAGTAGSQAAAARMSRLEYAANLRLLPLLSNWCDKYRSVKAVFAAEKARHEAEVFVLARMKRAEAMKRSLTLPIGSENDVKAAGAKASAEASSKVAFAVEVCRCGYAEVWHEGAGAEDVLAGICGETAAPSFAEEFPPAKTFNNYNHNNNNSNNNNNASATVLGQSLHDATRRKQLNGSAMLAGGRLVLKF
ncbi:unnamed protein product [Polarella glacialis]|uniref:Uncharacterized protein n=1 Tax=Polarella glacialis TaxID=89957 RepID=A0A813G5F6_POLGL|nr:unnamed protein product [Polarella glacialis]